MWGRQPRAEAGAKIERWTRGAQVGDNGVHGSASPFEALAERANWLGSVLDTDTFGQAMLSGGFSEETIASWSKDPKVRTSKGSESAGR